MGTSASTGGSLTKQSQSTHEITAKGGTPGPRPYSAVITFNIISIKLKIITNFTNFIKSISKRFNNKK